MVEILLATYNGEKYISEQLDSIMNQSYQDFVVIVRDDGSSDNTVSIIKDYIGRYPEKIRLIEDNKNIGNAGANFIELTGYASADYIMYCDQDDFWKKEKIQITLDRMKSLEKKYGTNEPILVFSSYEAVGSKLESIKNNRPYIYKLDLAHILVQNSIAGCMSMLNKALYEKLGDNDDAFIMHDWWMALVAACLGRIDYIEQPTMLYRQHGGNVVGLVRLTSMRSRLRKFKNPYTKRLMFLYEKQARVLLQRYGDIMPAESRDILEKFFEIFDEKKRIRRPGMLVRGGFLKSDWVRVIGQMWYLIRYDRDIIEK